LVRDTKNAGYLRIVGTGALNFFDEQLKMTFEPRKKESRKDLHSGIGVYPNPVNASHAAEKN
jgi:hypothetical protein